MVWIRKIYPGLGSHEFELLMNLEDLELLMNLEEFDLCLQRTIQSSG